jgi:hypothetical protein
MLPSSMCLTCLRVQLYFTSGSTADTLIKAELRGWKLLLAPRKEFQRGLTVHVRCSRHHNLTQRRKLVVETCSESTQLLTTVACSWRQFWVFRIVHGTSYWPMPDRNFAAEITYKTLVHKLQKLQIKLASFAYKASVLRQTVISRRLQ